MTHTIATLLLVLACPAASGPAVEPLDVQELMARKAEWPKLAREQTTISLEGRFAARTGKLLRLQNCDLVFRVNSGVLIPRLRNDRNVEVIGYLKDNGKQIDFIVQRIGESPSDLENLVARRKALSKDDAAPWFELADHAARRAAFYEDSVLLRESRETVKQGFAIERAKVPRGDADALMKLAERSQELGLAKSLRTEMTHQALRWRWDAIQKDPAANAGDFLKVLERELRGCTQPVLLANPKLRAKYRTDPILAYEQGNISERLSMHRYFYREVLLPQITNTARADGSNGAEIARLIRGNVPEELDLAVDYERRELKWRLQNVESATRSDMLELVDLLERGNQRKDAEAAKRRWVQASERRLAPRGPAGLVQSAMEYDSLLGDRTRAVKLLKRAWQESPEKSEIEERLERYGVYRRNNAWLTKPEVDSLPDNQMEQAQREGKVLRGMSPAQVRRTLGKPDRISRFASAGKVHVIWLFGSSRTSRTGVMFERRMRQPDDSAKVVSVTTLPVR